MADCSCNNFPAGLGNVTVGASLGVGTTSPQGALHVEMAASSDSSAPKFFSSAMAGGAFAEIIIGANLNGYSWAGMRYTNGAGVAANSHLAFFNGGDAETLVVHGGGLVGVGTSDPAHKLTVSGGWVATDNGYGLAFRDGGGTYRIGLQIDGSNNVQLGDGGTNGYFALYAGGAERLRVDTSGDLGIGTTNPGAPLQVNAPVNTIAFMLNGSNYNSGNQSVNMDFTNGGSGSGGAHSFSRVANLSDFVPWSGDLAFYTNPGTYQGSPLVERMRILYNGYVGIGKTSPQQPLDVNGTISCGGLLTGNINVGGAIYNSAGSQKVVDGGGCYYAS